MTLTHPGWPLTDAIMFGAYESTQRFLENHLASKDARTFLAGSVGGLLTVPFVTSTDLLKCRLQMDRVKGFILPSLQPNTEANPMQVARGDMRGL